MDIHGEDFIACIVHFENKRVQKKLRQSIFTCLNCMCFSREAHLKLEIGFKINFKTIPEFFLPWIEKNFNNFEIFICQNTLLMSSHNYFFSSTVIYFTNTFNLSNWNGLDIFSFKALLFSLLSPSDVLIIYLRTFCKAGFSLQRKNTEKNNKKKGHMFLEFLFGKTEFE